MDEDYLTKNEEVGDRLLRDEDMGGEVVQLWPASKPLRYLVCSLCRQCFLSALRERQPRFLLLYNRKFMAAKAQVPQPS